MEKLNRELGSAESRQESVRQRSMLHDPFESRDRNRRSSSKIEFLRLMDSLMKQNKEISLKVIESSQKVLEMNNDESNDEEDIEETNRLRELIDKKNIISKKVDSTRDKVMPPKESPVVCRSVAKPTGSAGKSTIRQDNKVESDEDEESENIGRDQIDTNNSMNSASMEEFVQRSSVVCKPVKPPVEMQITATRSGRITKIEPRREEFVTRDYLGRCMEGEFIEEGICNLPIASKESPTKEDIKRMHKTIYYIVRRIRDHESSARGSAYYIQKHKAIDIAGKGRFFVCDLFCYAYFQKARCKAKIRFEYNVDQSVYKLFMVGEHNHSFNHRNDRIGRLWDSKFENTTHLPAIRVLRTNIIDDDDEKSDEMAKRSEDAHNLDKNLSLESSFPEIKNEPI